MRMPLPRQPVLLLTAHAPVPAPAIVSAGGQTPAFQLPASGAGEGQLAVGVGPAFGQGSPWPRENVAKPIVQFCVSEGARLHPQCLLAV
jgi:hypothetical protein